MKNNPLRGVESASLATLSSAKGSDFWVLGRSSILHIYLESIRIGALQHFKLLGVRYHRSKG